MNINAITDIKNVLTKEEFEEFDKTFWEHPEETIEDLKKTHPEILLVNENTPNVCNLDGYDYETPSGVVAVVKLSSVISTQKFHVGKTALFEGKILEVTHNDWPSGFCELHIKASHEGPWGDSVMFFISEYDDGIPRGV